MKNVSNTVYNQMQNSVFVSTTLKIKKWELIWYKLKHEVEDQTDVIVTPLLVRLYLNE